MKKNTFLIIGIVMITVSFTIGTVINFVEKTPDKQKNLKLSGLEDENLKEWFLENFSRRMELEKFFVFNFKELELRETDDVDNLSAILKLNQLLSRDLSEIAGKPKNFALFRPWMLDLNTVEEILLKVAQGKIYVIFDKKQTLCLDLIEDWGKTRHTNIINFSIKAKSDFKVFSTKEAAWEFLKTNDPLFLKKINK